MDHQLNINVFSCAQYDLPFKGIKHEACHKIPIQQGAIYRKP